MDSPLLAYQALSMTSITDACCMTLATLTAVHIMSLCLSPAKPQPSVFQSLSCLCTVQSGLLSLVYHAWLLSCTCLCQGANSVAFLCSCLSQYLGAAFAFDILA